MLTFEPEPFEQLRRRLPAALQVRWDAAVIEASPQTADRPGLLRAHVFDTPYLIRLIVSVDFDSRQPEMPPVLHTSGSFREGFEWLGDNSPTTEERAAHVISAFEELCPVAVGGRMRILVRPSGIVHLFYRLDSHVLAAGLPMSPGHA